MTLKQLKGKTCQHDLATLREGPLENLWGGGRGRAKYKKNIRLREIKWKKIHARKLILKNIHATAKKNSYKEFDKEKKIPQISLWVLF